MFEESFPTFTADFGSPVIFGNQHTMALFDRTDVDVLAGRAQSTQYRIEYPRTDLVGLSNGDTLLIGIGPGWKFDSTGTRLQYTGNNPLPESAQFKVLGSPDLLDDGAFMSAALERL